eukprot:1291931-Alexandrium_andersonii.AAC.1
MRASSAKDGSSKQTPALKRPAIPCPSTANHPGGTTSPLRRGVAWGRCVGMSLAAGAAKAKRPPNVRRGRMS